MTRFELINELIKRWGYTKYLEIGLSTGDCFKEIQCDRKQWIDPNPLCFAPGGIYMPSDDAFAAMDDGEKFDLIFIDGDHRCPQVLKDIDNAVNRLSEQGTIVMHDCNPQSETAQLPYPTSGDWNGDVWKAYVLKRAELSGTHVMMVVDTDQGLGVIRRLTDFNLHANAVYGNPRLEDLTWHHLQINRQKLLQLISVEKFLDWDSLAQNLHSGTGEP